MIPEKPCSDCDDRINCWQLGYNKTCKAYQKWRKQILEYIGDE